MSGDSASVPLEIIRELHSVPVISIDDCLKVALEAMTSKKLGFCLILNQEQNLISVLSDGDLRRLLLGFQAPLPALLIAPASKFASANPISFPIDGKLIELKNLFTSHRVQVIPVINKSLQVSGVISAFDALSLL